MRELAKSNQLSADEQQRRARKHAWQKAKREGQLELPLEGEPEK
jgi:hypothetical protein